ncbi:MAG: hypothetical protein ACE15D_06155 [Candidatus Eisenbacteria bacterium]
MMTMRPRLRFALPARLASLATLCLLIVAAASVPAARAGVPRVMVGEDFGATW